MRVHDTDPSLRRYDDNAPLVNCPRCHTFMVPLANHELSAGDDPTLDSASADFFLFSLAIYLWAYVFNFLFGAAALAAKKRKLVKLKSEVLPQSPNALICPACLHLKR